jgi:hypothetical protein
MSVGREALHWQEERRDKTLQLQRAYGAFAVPLFIPRTLSSTSISPYEINAQLNAYNALMATAGVVAGGCSPRQRRGLP